MRILFSATPTPGHVFPLLSLAQAVRNDDHDVALLTSAGITSLIPHDIPVLGAGPTLDALFAEVTRRVGADPTTDPRPTVLAELFAATRVDLTIGEAMAATYRWRPDLVVGEWRDFVGPIVARALVVPAIRLAYAPAYEREYEEAMAAAVAVRYGELGLTPVDPAAILDTCPPSLQSTSWRPTADWIPLRPQPHDGSASAWKSPDFGGVSDRPAVLVNLGTVLNDTALLNRIIAELERLDVNVLVTVDPAGDPSRVTTAAHALDGRYIKAGASSVCDEIAAMPPASYVIKLLTHGLAEAA